MGKRKVRQLDAEIDTDDDKGTAADTAPGTSAQHKEKVLLVSSRGIPFRHRHLMLDLLQLIPHSKKDAKLDTKTNRAVINEVAEMKGCTSVLFFESRKKKDLYLWVSKAPDGPCAKFHVNNVHTMAELKLSGNHLKGSRPVLSFDKAFDDQPHLQLLKEMLTQVFATPKTSPRVKPFFDHIISFHFADNRIWIRNYQVVVPLTKNKVNLDDVSLVEVGPRCCLNPILCLSGSFSGPVLYENPSYVSPNQIRSMLKRKAAGKYNRKVTAREKRKRHEAENPLPQDELRDVFK